MIIQIDESFWKQQLLPKYICSLCNELNAIVTSPKWSHYYGEAACSKRCPLPYKIVLVINSRHNCHHIFYHCSQMAHIHTSRYYARQLSKFLSIHHAKVSIAFCWLFHLNRFLTILTQEIWSLVKFLYCYKYFWCHLK